MVTRRELLQGLGGAALASLPGDSAPGVRRANLDNGTEAAGSAYNWIRSARLLIAEGYNPPFYPSFDYEPEKALGIAKQLNADSLRYPTASYYAYYPTKTRYPIHPELGERDPFRRTVELFHEAGLRVVAYNPLNHPFMDVRTHNPDYEDWMRRDSAGRPLTTRHLGWTEYYEGCLNSPYRSVIKARVLEVISQYPVDVMYFDGPYEGMESAERFCHCRYCQAAYRQARGKNIPLQNSETGREEEAEYRRWMADDVVVGFLREIRDTVRQTRDVPVLFNNTGLLDKHEWRAHGFRVVDGFMFEAADTPEEKLFNLQLGRSTGKVIWTYLSSHTQYNREHMKDRSVLGWYSYPLEGQQLLLDGAVATAAGVGYCYWGMQRFFYQPEGPLAYESGQYVREIFDFADRYHSWLPSLRPAPPAGILVGAQTINSYQGQKFVPGAYRNYYHGAFHLLKGLNCDSEPFLDYEMTREQLAKYPLLIVPNAPCLSENQCALLSRYVEEGGTLVATHLTSVADEVGRTRGNYGLADLFGIELKSVEPVEIPDLYLRPLPSGGLIPQDLQVVLFRETRGGEVVAETYDRGHHRTLGPAVVTRRQGKGQAIYIGSGLEAIYCETLLEPVRTYWGSLLEPVLKDARTYEVEFRLGLTPHYMASADRLLLYLLSNTANDGNKLLARRQFLPLANVKVRIRIPSGRQVRSVSLLRARQTPPWTLHDRWVTLTVPRVQVFEAVQVELR